MPFNHVSSLSYSSAVLSMMSGTIPLYVERQLSTCTFAIAQASALNPFRIMVRIPFFLLFTLGLFDYTEKSSIISDYSISGDYLSPTRDRCNSMSIVSFTTSGFTGI